MGNDTTPEILILGNVTRDVAPGAPDGFTFGGTATFASLAASRLGRRTALVTAAAHEPGLSGIFRDVDVEVVQSSATTTFENVYAPNGRVQYVRAVASPLVPTDIPDAWRRAPMVHFGPIAQELTRDLLDVFPSTALIGATLQGWLRAWSPDDGRVSPVAWRHAETYLDRLDVITFSAEDLGGDMVLVEEYATRARLAVVTENRHGCVVWQHGSRRRFPAYDVEEVDPTGAGDVFATAFLIRYGETRDIETAAQFANCVASFVVEGRGAEAIPTGAMVGERLRDGSLRPPGS